MRFALALGQHDCQNDWGPVMRFRKAIYAAGLLLAVGAAPPPPPEQFMGANFEINRDRVQFGTLGSCAKGTTYLVPTVYLYIAARTKVGAGGTLGKAGVRGTVYTDGFTKGGIQQLAAQMQNEIVSQLRAAGHNVLTFDDVRADVADKRRMEVNPRYGMPTKSMRQFPGIDFFVATPSDEQAIDSGMMGPQSNYTKAAQRTGATLLFPQVWLTLPQVWATSSTTEGMTWRSSQAGVGGNPSMKLAGAWINGLTAKGAWCSITVPEHGGRLPAPVAGTFQQLSTSTNDYGEWSVKSGDWSFAIDDAAVRTGAQAVGRSLGKLVTDSMEGRK